MGEGVRTVDDQRDAPSASHAIQLGHRQDLAGEVDHVTSEDSLGARRYGILEEAHDFVRGPRRARES